MVDLDAPFFTVAELAHIAGLDRGQVDVWLRRGVIQPTRIERLNVRSRSLFSVGAIFEAKLIRVLGEHLAIGPSDSLLIAKESEAAILAKVTTDDGKWKWHVARHLEKSDPLDLFATLSRVDKCWQIVLHVGGKNITTDFGLEVPRIVLPIAAIFSPVYNECKAMLSSQSMPKKRKKARRARR